MRSTALNNLKPSRLRKVMWLSFFALAIPMAFLIYKSYDQLKWEAFYQHRVLAEELSNTIDQKFRELIRAEEQRAFSDYTFATVSEKNSSLINRSTLSNLPIKSASQGVIGYFQIDADGQFSTPFLPSPSEAVKQYASTLDDQNQRELLQAKIENILSSNQLVEKTFLETEELPKIEVVENKDDTTSNAIRFQKNQAGFDRLSESKSPVNEKTFSVKKRTLDRLKELEVSSPYKEKVVLRKRETVKKGKAEIAELELSSLSDVSFGDEISNKESTLNQQSSPSANINLFKNTKDPFEVSLLDSGHFVLYRKVWKDEQRYIQGILLDKSVILQSLIKDSFTNSLLSSMSNLTVIYQGNALASFTETSRSYLSRDSALGGTLLLRARLSAPFSELEPVFTIRRLPAGAGGKVVLWAALITALTLIAVIYSLYRISLKNLSLVNQQQDFVSAVSHELKTPLTSIRMYGEILQQGWASEEKKKTYYSFIFDESERLTRLINNVLELARMTRNETPISLQAVTINELVDIIRSKIDSQIERAQFKLKIKIDDSVTTKRVNIDQDIFAQIMINLVDNALKFSGDAIVKVIDLNVQQQSNGTLCFSIRDYGPGIAKDQLKKIFTLFYRTENELTRSTTGTGIGLALVHQLTQLMDGKVDVINREPGAEFQIFFPEMQ